MPSAELVQDRWIQIDGIEYRDRDMVHQLPGYSYKGNVTRCPVSWPALKILVDMFPDRLDIGEQLRGWAWRESSQRIIPACDSHDWAMNPANDADGNDLLYPYQRTGTLFLLDAVDGAALTDEMGTGKTAHAIELLEQDDHYPALIVCPKSAKTGWAREFKKWAPWRKVEIIGGTSQQRRSQLGRLDQPLCDSHSVIQHDNTMLLTCVVHAMKKTYVNETKGLRSDKCKMVGVGETTILNKLKLENDPHILDVSTISQWNNTMSCLNLKVGTALYVLVPTTLSLIIVIEPTASGEYSANVATLTSPHQIETLRGLIEQGCTCPPDVAVMTWESLRIHSRLAPYGSVRLSKDEKTPKELNRHWGAVVADEAHRGVDPKAKQTRALWAVSAEADYRLALTGTPIANTPADFWSILHFVAPHEWPSRTRYIERYCLQMYNAWGGLDVTGLQHAHAEEFHDLVKPRHLRRPKDLVLPWLPEKVFETIDVEMSRPQAKAYNDLKKSVVADVQGGTIMGLDSLTLLTRFTQAACATLTMEGEQVVLAAPSSKVDALVDLLNDMGEAPLVVFALSRQLIELAAQRLDKEKITYSKIVGGQSDLVRMSEENAFHDGQARVILLTLGAGSEALTLTRANTTCFMQRSWSMVQNRQAEDRTHRPGQDADKVLIIDMVAPGTVEEVQWQALQAKGSMMEEITQDRQAMLRAIKGGK